MEFKRQKYINLLTKVVSNLKFINLYHLYYQFKWKFIRNCAKIEVSGEKLISVKIIE